MLKLNEAMREGFAYYFKGTQYEEVAKKIKLDPKAWGPYFPEKGEITVGGKMKVPVSTIHIDPRAQSDYDRFSRYFDEPDTELL